MSQISIFFGNLTIFWQNEPHIDQEVDVKKATDQEQETWVMPVPCYIAEISIFVANLAVFLAITCPLREILIVPKPNTFGKGKMAQMNHQGMYYMGLMKN